MSLLPQPCDSCLPEVKAACAAGATKRMTAKSTARFMGQVDRKSWVMMAALVIPQRAYAKATVGSIAIHHPNEPSPPSASLSLSSMFVNTSSPTRIIPSIHSIVRYPPYRETSHRAPSVKGVQPRKQNRTPSRLITARQRARRSAC